MTKHLMLFAACTALVAACGGPELEDEADAAEFSATEDAATATIPFTVVNFAPGSAVGQSEQRVLVKTAAQFRTLTGVTATSVGIDFSRSWAVFYSAGVKRTGGYAAAVEKIQLSGTGKTLTITTALTSPGTDCMVTQALTKPVVLVKFAKPRGTQTIASRFLKHDTTKSCTRSTCATVRCAADTYCDDISGQAQCLPLPSCAGVQCETGTSCELVQVQCIRAPCPPQPQCVPIPTGCATMRCMQGTFCGEQTPGHAACIPYSTCMNVRCTSGTHCEDLPIVCAKAPCPPTAPQCVPN